MNAALGMNAGDAALGMNVEGLIDVAAVAPDDIGALVNVAAVAPDDIGALAAVAPDDIGALADAAGVAPDSLKAIDASTGRWSEVGFLLASTSKPNCIRLLIRNCNLFASIST
jgi:hypothetical protein